MRISLETPENQRAISTARTQIRNTEDLRKFDTFLAHYQVIDFDDETIAAAARSSCFGENCCQEVNININFSFV